VPSNFDVIQGRYFSDLMNQPEALGATWELLRGAEVLKEIGRECGKGRFERVVLTGMGGSYFGLHPLAMELAASGWTPMMVETSELIHYYPELLRGINAGDCGVAVGEERGDDAAAGSQRRPSEGDRGDELGG
jgi:hypothetical protein